MDQPTKVCVAVFNDDPMILTVVKDLLEMEGFTAVVGYRAEFETGQRSWTQFLDEYGPLGVVYDIRPPFLPDWTLLQAFREAAEKREIGFVVTTTSRSGLVTAVGDIEAFELVSKPFDIDDLLDAVRRAISAAV